MKYRFGVIFSLVLLTFYSCGNVATIKIKNSSFFNPILLVKVSIDDLVVFNGELKYDGNEYGAIEVGKKIKFGKYKLKVDLPESGISELKEVNFNNSHKYCYISIVDNTSNRSYKKGEIKVSITTLIKDLY